MKATLEYTLPEEATEHMLAINAATLSHTVWEVDQQCRNWLKHGCDLERDQAIDHIRDLLRECLGSVADEVL